MCNQKEEVEVEVENEELHTRRLEARAEMLQALPAVISSLAPIVDAVAKVSISRHETLGGRLAEIELDTNQRSDSFLDRLIDLGREFHVFSNLERMLESDVNLEIAENDRTIRDLKNSETKVTVKSGRKAKK